MLWRDQKAIVSKQARGDHTSAGLTQQAEKEVSISDEKGVF